MSQNDFQTKIDSNEFLTDLGNNDHINTYKALNSVIVALGAFKGKYEKRLNLSRLLKSLKIEKKEGLRIVSLLKKFQEIFYTVLQGYEIDEKVANNQIYIKLKPMNNIETQKKEAMSNPKTINFSSRDSELLSDIIFLFKNVNRGKGFDMAQENNSMTINLRTLHERHPCLFHRNGNDLLYPTNLSMELSDIIQSYKKSKRSLGIIKLNNCEVIFKDDL